VADRASNSAQVLEQELQQLQLRQRARQRKLEANTNASLSAQRPLHRRSDLVRSRAKLHLDDRKLRRRALRRLPGPVKIWRSVAQLREVQSALQPQRECDQRRENQMLNTGKPRSVAPVPNAANAHQRVRLGQPKAGRRRADHLLRHRRNKLAHAGIDDQPRRNPGLICFKLGN